MPKRRATEGGQTSGTRTFSLQIQWFRAPRLSAALVLAYLHKIATDARARVVFQQTQFAADADDHDNLTEPFTDFVIDAPDAGAVWAGLAALLADRKLGPGLRRSAIIHCTLVTD